MSEQDLKQQSLDEQRKAYRVRHEVKFRLLDVLSVSPLSSSMLRVVLHGEDLSGFNSLGFDDHVKVFFPSEKTQQIAVPSMGEKGLQFPDGEKPTMRDYTPRSFDADAKTLTIDFAIHDAGPATTWAQQAKVGDQLAIGGPRGSMVIPLAFDGYVFFLVMILLTRDCQTPGRAPVGAKALVVVEVNEVQDQIVFQSKAAVETVWLHRQGQAVGQTGLFDTAVNGLNWPTGAVHTWIAAETSVARHLRRQLIERYDLEKSWVKAAGYWQHGEVAAHSNINED